MNKLIAIVLIILLSPVLIFVALFIILSDGYPFLYTQKKYGLNNKVFWIYKFRTMRNDTPNIATHLISSKNNYNTRFGKNLRKLSIDELPQLINILKGDMRFIGPRPALYNQYDLIDLRTKSGIHKILPGITGWAQINGRDELSISEKIELDEYYLMNRSILLNVKIVILTISQIFIPKGVSH